MSDADSEFVTPPPAEPGDKVAVIAPSSGAAAIFPDVLDLALDRLHENPEMRADDIHEAFRDSETSTVFATIGGDDQIRVLKHLDPEIIRENPTRFFGMSDNTCLASYLWSQGVVSYYGGQLLNNVATSGHFPEYTERYLRRALFEHSFDALEPAEEWTDDTIEWGNDDFGEVVPEYESNDGWHWDVPDARAGETVSGHLWGGCLTVLQWLLAADRAVPDPTALDGAVLALETSEELPSARAVRRILTCFGERGLFAPVDAVLVGRPQTRNREGEYTDEERETYRAEQRSTIREWVREYNPDAPIVFDLDFGHTNPNAPVPLGGRVEIDTQTRSIRFP